MLEKNKGGKQTGFLFMEPPLEVFLTRGDKPVPTYVVREFREFDGRKRVRTNISTVEKWLPFFYWREGLIEKPENIEYGERAEIASVVGQELHNADVLFNLITQGTVGAAVKRGLPSARQEDLDNYGLATELFEVYKNIDEREVLEMMVEAWKRFLDARIKQENKKVENFPMFDDLGFTNPLLIPGVLKSDNLYEEGLLLARHWASRYFKGKKGEWGHGVNHQSVNEVLTIVNTELLQIMGRLDRVTREEKARKTVTVQVTDFKTGRREVRSEIQQEIRKRQAQLALFMAERFTTHYILDKRWLRHGGKGFALNTSVLNSAAMGRARFFYRWFDRTSGEVDWEEVTMKDDERDDFVEWLIWYSSKAQEYREELKKLR